MQQKQIDRIVARTGKSRDVLTCEKNSEKGIPRFGCMLAAALSTERKSGLTSRANAQVIRPAVTHWLVKDTVVMVSRGQDITRRQMLTEIHNNDPALHERNDPPAARNLVEYLRAC